MDQKPLLEDLATEDVASHYKHFAPARRFQETVEPCLGEPFTLALDVGCGDGLLLAALSNRLAVGDARLFGVDLSESRLRHARQQVRSQVSYADATSMPFEAGLFDL